MKIKTQIRVDGINRLQELLQEQQALVNKVIDNAAEIERTVNQINVDLSIEKATS